MHRPRRLALLAVAMTFACRSPDGTLTWDTRFVEELDTEYIVGTYVHPDASLDPGAPWMLLLDGDIALEIVASDLDREVRRGRARPIVLVGIGNQDTRDRDYLPVPETVTPPEGGWVDAFGAVPWFDFLTGTFVPETEAELGIGGDRSARILGGHSYGGLATLYALHLHRDTWSGFAASSPSLWVDDGIPFEWADELPVGEAAPSTLYLSMGSTESPPMNVLFTEFVERVDEREPADLVVKSEVLYGFNHFTAPERAFAHALRVVAPAEDP